MVKHLLVTNDYPPKIGGIQSYLWELWRRLPPDEVAVLTTPYAGAAEFDRQQQHRIERTQQRVLWPTPKLVRQINQMADAHDAEIVLLDPALICGPVGPQLDRPYGLVIHGAEVTVPGRLPVSRPLLGRLLRGASIVIAAGSYPLQEAERAANAKLQSVTVPPGVDSDRFSTLQGRERSAARTRFGVKDNDFVLATVNRLVPRKGIPTVIRAASKIRQERNDVSLKVLVGGVGRQQRNLSRLIAETESPTNLLGKISDSDVARLYGCADLMVMMCNERWFGLEQEGFGIAFLEAAAAGIPQIAGRSGGSHEAVAHGTTGLVLNDSRDIDAVASAIESLIDDKEKREHMGRQAKIRAKQTFDYDQLAKELQTALEKLEF